MSEVIVDARGQLCPKPLILTRQALNENIVGTQFIVLVDNETSCQNVERFLRDNGMTPHISADGSEFILRFTKHAPELAAPDATAYCAPAGGASSSSSSSSSYVVALAADYVGRGSEELGRVLVKGLLETLGAVATPPTHLILYSSGILLAVDGSPCVEALRALERRGVNLLICGACVDYYRKKTEIHVGTISNMLTILETQIRAGKIIAP